jgi:hypothetical protein
MPYISRKPTQGIKKPQSEQAEICKDEKKEKDRRLVGCGPRCRPKPARRRKLMRGTHDRVLEKVKTKYKPRRGKRNRRMLCILYKK